MHVVRWSDSKQVIHFIQIPIKRNAIKLSQQTNMIVTKKRRGNLMRPGVKSNIQFSPLETHIQRAYYTEIKPLKFTFRIEMWTVPQKTDPSSVKWMNSNLIQIQVSMNEFFMWHSIVCKQTREKSEKNHVESKTKTPPTKRPSAVVVHEHWRQKADDK